MMLIKKLINYLKNATDPKRLHGSVHVWKPRYYSC